MCYFIPGRKIGYLKFYLVVILLICVLFLLNNTFHPKTDFLTKSVCQILAHLENTNIIVNELILSFYQ